MPIDVVYDQQVHTAATASAPVTEQEHLQCASGVSICTVRFLLLSCRGLEAVKRSERVYLEAYTSLLLVPKEKLVRVDWLGGVLVQVVLGSCRV